MAENEPKRCGTCLYGRADESGCDIGCPDWGLLRDRPWASCRLHKRDEAGDPPRGGRVVVLRRCFDGWDMVKGSYAARPNCPGDILLEVCGGGSADVADAERVLGFLCRSAATVAGSWRDAREWPPEEGRACLVYQSYFGGIFMAALGGGRWFPAGKDFPVNLHEDNYQWFPLPEPPPRARPMSAWRDARTDPPPAGARVLVASWTGVEWFMFAAKHDAEGNGFGPRWKSAGDEGVGPWSCMWRPLPEGPEPPAKEGD